MDDADHPIKVVDNTDEWRYEVRVGGRIAGFALYHPATKDLVLTHTHIVPPYQERGIDYVLARGLLDDIRRRGRLVEPICPLISTFIRENPEYLDLVTAASLPLLQGDDS